MISGDVFTIGNHAYRYIEVESAAMNYSRQSQMDGTIPGLSSSSSGDIVVPGSSSAGGAKKKRMILYGVVGGVFILLLIVLMASGDDKDKKNAAEQKDKEQGLSTNKEMTAAEIEKAEPQEPNYATKIPDDMKEFFDRANAFYFEGKRELRMENYARALESFKKAITFYPNHAKAQFYIKKLNFYYIFLSLHY